MFSIFSMFSLFSIYSQLTPCSFIQEQFVEPCCSYISYILLSARHIFVISCFQKERLLLKGAFAIHCRSCPATISAQSQSVAENQLSLSLPRLRRRFTLRRAFLYLLTQVFLPWVAQPTSLSLLDWREQAPLAVNTALCRLFSMRFRLDLCQTLSMRAR